MAVYRCQWFFPEVGETQTDHDIKEAIAANQVALIMSGSIDMARHIKRNTNETLTRIQENFDVCKRREIKIDKLYNEFQTGKCQQQTILLDAKKNLQCILDMEKKREQERRRKLIAHRSSRVHHNKRHSIKPWNNVDKLRCQVQKEQRQKRNLQQKIRKLHHTLQSINKKKTIDQTWNNVVKLRQLVQKERRQKQKLQQEIKELQNSLRFVAS